MLTTRHARRALIVAALLPSPVLAQDFNIDIGAAGTAVPPASYGAAGSPGVWNAVVLPHTTPALGPQAFDEPLVDLAGNPTGVGVHQFGGQAWVADADAALSGPDAALLEDALVTNSTSLDSCLYLNGLENGTYEVLTYMWMPNHPEVVHKSLFDFVPGTETNTGSWTGSHAEGVSYTRTIVEVTNGFMGPHAGLAPGGDPVLGGAINGLQIRKLGCETSNFCSSGPNSSGSAAVMGTNGECSISANGFELQAGPTPDTIGLFFCSSTQVNGGAGIPFGNGLRCVGGPGGIFRLRPASITGNTMRNTLDLTDPPQPAGLITPGSTWYFQGWFRDIPAGGAEFDTSDGICVTFGP